MTMPVAAVTARPASIGTVVRPTAVTSTATARTATTDGASLRIVRPPGPRPVNTSPGGRSGRLSTTPRSRMNKPTPASSDVPGNCALPHRMHSAPYT
ncbi:hypothetical protein [Actinoplanes palleronii]|uniref:hypothetical protein n=1 Tax=Actinoplanes palleronii TaxID=113570 RepID=UPI0019423766|nr:hypothetical protein [Actinoplanes palleronii]